MDKNMVYFKGQETGIEPRLVKLLQILRESRGSVVTKAMLMKSLWTETIVTEDSLTKAISKLRKILDTGLSTSSIKTINGVGYELRKPTIGFHLKHRGMTIALVSVIVFLLYVLLGSGIVEWAMELKSHLASP